MVVALPLIMPTQLYVPSQASSNEKNLVIIQPQMEWIGEVTSMVIADIEHKPV
jgi:hypothetical protein